MLFFGALAVALSLLLSLRFSRRLTTAVADLTRAGRALLGRRAGGARAIPRGTMS